MAAKQRRKRSTGTETPMEAAMESMAMAWNGNRRMVGESDI